MNVKLIYHTPELHKLVEAVARVCYQSYDKLSPVSHNMLKSIMKKGHLSVASVGNIVFEIDLSNVDFIEEFFHVYRSLLAFKEINNYIRWTTPYSGKGRKNVITVSMNILTLADIFRNSDIKDKDTEYDLLLCMVREVRNVPCLYWFLDESVEVPPSYSPYIAEPTLGNPVVLSQDYTALKALGLNDYELDIHATVTVDMVTDRATGLQMWRHADMTGGCELSQRYVDRSNAEIREMVNVNKYPTDLEKYAEAEGLTMEEAKEHYDAVIQTLRNWNQKTVELYSDASKTLQELGVSGKRAKEIARSILPNAIATRIIHCRPLRQWKHFFELRDSIHAQPEIMMDAKALKDAFIKEGIPVV